MLSPLPAIGATGDEDDPRLGRLAVFPNTGHGLNLEEPSLFNQTLADFFHQVETNR